jgi:hypothetical protein
MKKIEKLNEEQIALMGAIRDEWLAKIFDKPIKLDKKQARLSVNWLYKLAGREAPTIIFLDSPMALQYGANILKGLFKNPQVRAQVGAQVRDQVWAQVWAQVGDQVWAQVWAQVGDQVRDQVRAQVWAQVGDQVRAQVEAQVRAQVRDQVGDQVRAQVEAQVRAQVRAQVGAQVWAQVGDQVWAQKLEAFSFADWCGGSIYDYGWVAFYDFFERLGLLSHENYSEFKKLLNAGIYDMIQLNGFCLVAPLPKFVRRDERNRLHSDKGAAIQWKDKYSQYYLHGVRFEEDLFKKVIKHKLSFKDIVGLENMEQRMAALKVYGTEKLLKSANAQLVDSAHGYELYQVDGVFNQSAYYLKYACPSTGRVYVSGIDPVIGAKKSAMSALEWKFYLNPGERFTLEDGESRIKAPRGQRKLYRHGDVSLHEIEKILKTAKELKDKTLAYGTATGHAHRFINPALIKRHASGEKFYLQVVKRAVVTHEEHGDMTIPKGFYEQIIEQEFDYAEQQIRTVID